MPKSLPKLSLSHGQVAWALSLGQPPEQKLLDQLRYLRQLGVPFNESELGTGRGNRVRYRFDHLIEAGVGIAALRRGMRPKDIVGFLVGRRKELRKAYRSAYLEQPDTALAADWVKSRGRSVPLIGNERFVRLHDRYSDAPGKIEMIRQDEIGDLSDFFSMVERYPGEKARTLLPLTRLVLELVAWALEAPETRPGPQ
jgi:hypothetical protein